MLLCGYPAFTSCGRIGFIITDLISATQLESASNVQLGRTPINHPPRKHRTKARLSAFVPGPGAHPLPPRPVHLGFDRTGKLLSSQSPAHLPPAPVAKLAYFAPGTNKQLPSYDGYVSHTIPTERPGDIPLRMSQEELEVKLGRAVGA